MRLVGMTDYLIQNPMSSITPHLSLTTFLFGSSDLKIPLAPASHRHLNQDCMLLSIISKNVNTISAFHRVDNVGKEVLLLAVSGRCRDAA